MQEICVLVRITIIIVQCWISHHDCPIHNLQPPGDKSKSALLLTPN